MYNDNYYPSMAEDLYEDPAAVYPDYNTEPDFSNEWLSSQESEPIMPLTDDQNMWSDQNNDMDFQGRSGRPMPPLPDRPMPPMPDRPMPPMPDRPVAPLPDRPGRPIPDRPMRPNPDRPVVPLPDRPGRPIPDRPMRPVPGRPVRPDWSWNWGTVLPGFVLPVSPARVRFYNAAIRGPIDIYINNRLVVSNLNFLNSTRFFNVAPGRYRITVYRSNDMRTPLVDTWMGFNQNRSYTVALTGAFPNYRLQTMTF